MLRYCLYIIGKFIVLNSPPPFSFGLALVISDLHYYLHFIDRKNVKRNIFRVTKSKEKVPQLTREMFRNFGRYLVEFFRMNKMVNASFIEENVIVENLGSIKKVLDQKKGAIILTAHIGNWELGALVLSELGYPLTVIALPHTNKRVNDFFNRQREEKGNMKVVPTNIGVRKCISELGLNHLVAVVGDRDFFNNGEEINFLGEKAIIPKGAAVFSLKTGAPIIPIFFIRTELNKYTLKIIDPIYPPVVSKGEENRKEAIKALINQYVPVIEGIIKQYPSQWLMFRDFARNSF